MDRAIFSSAAPFFCISAAISRIFCGSFSSTMLSA